MSFNRPPAAGLPQKKVGGEGGLLDSPPAPLLDTPPPPPVAVAVTRTAASATLVKSNGFSPTSLPSCFELEDLICFTAVDACRQMACEAHAPPDLFYRATQLLHVLFSKPSVRSTFLQHQQQNPNNNTTSLQVSPTPSASSMSQNQNQNKKEQGNFSGGSTTTSSSAISNTPPHLFYSNCDDLLCGAAAALMTLSKVQVFRNIFALREVTILVSKVREFQQRKRQHRGFSDASGGGSSSSSQYNNNNNTNTTTTNTKIELQEIQQRIIKWEWILLEASAFRVISDTPHTYAITLSASIVPLIVHIKDESPVTENMSEEEIKETLLKSVVARVNDSARSSILVLSTHPKIVSVAAIALALEEEFKILPQFEAFTKRFIEEKRKEKQEQKEKSASSKKSSSSSSSTQPVTDFAWSACLFHELDAKEAVTKIPVAMDCLRKLSNLPYSPQYYLLRWDLIAAHRRREKEEREKVMRERDEKEKQRKEKEKEKEKDSHHHHRSSSHHHSHSHSDSHHHHHHHSSSSKSHHDDKKKEGESKETREKQREKEKDKKHHSSSSHHHHHSSSSATAAAVASSSSSSGTKRDAEKEREKRFSGGCDDDKKQRTKSSSDHHNHRSSHRSGGGGEKESGRRRERD